MVSPLQQKVRVKGPVVVTANRLFDGSVIYRTAAGLWTDKLGGAEIFRSAKEALKTLKAAQGESLEAVGPYLAPIEQGEPFARPANLRERIRINGPTFVLPSEATAVAASNRNAASANPPAYGIAP
jgi:hypothetical protein